MRREAVAISPITEIIAEIRAGRIVILVDDEDRENEGDLVFAAEFVGADKINFLAKHGRGLVCMPITEEHAARLGLRPMVEQNRSRHGTNFTASIEAAEGIASGISAHDRALTIKVAAAPEARPEDIVQPGHVFPLIAQPGGVLLGDRHAHQAAAVLGEEIDLVGRDELGGEDEVALVLAVLVVDEHGHAPGLQLGDDFLDRIEAHGSVNFTPIGAAPFQQERIAGKGHWISLLG